MTVAGGWRLVRQRWCRKTLPAVAGLLVIACTAPASPPDQPTGSRAEADAVATGAPLPSQTPGPAPARSELVVVEVTDGDTFDVRIGGQVETVRLIGVNAPESGECLSQAATDLLADLLAAGPLQLETDASDRDQFGRLLRYVYAGDTFVNAALVEAGMALAREYPPDTARSAELDSAQQRAEEAARGIWAADACGPATAAMMEIVALNADAPGDDGANPNGEWVEVRNAGAEPVDLTSWTVKDTSASHRYAFPDGFTLPPGATVRLHTGCGTDTAAALYWCEQRSAVWNNDGDTAFLADPSGNTVATWPY